MQLVKQLWSLFNRRERWQLGILTVALILRAGVEMMGVASIMPFMSVVADPSIVERSEYLAAVYEWFGFADITAFLTVLGIAVVTMLAVANAVGAGATYGIVRFTHGMQHRLSIRLLKGYLSQPYSFFVQHNSATLNKTLLTEVKNVISGVMTPVLDIGARALVVGGLVALLIVLDPMLALIVAFTLGGAYGVVYMLIKKKQRRLGIQRVKANRERFKVSGEAFGGIKDVKVLQREKAFVDRFKPASWQYTKAAASNAVISQMPRYLLETIAFGGIVLIVLYLLQSGNGVSEILPVISLYAFAGYRMLPELQKLFGDAARIRFHHAALDDLLDQYHALAMPELGCTEQYLPVNGNIIFDEVCFTYPGAAIPALERVSLRIDRNQTIGFVGASGSGKTTLVDLLLGLYAPDEGRILIDGVPLNQNVHCAWRRQIGYVPQHIFLIDDTIWANIAFGVPTHEILRKQVIRAAFVAHVHEFITTLPQGYETVVGERGVRLSGGQRQRIGIARALYHDPSVLVMDEATSSLDGVTEDAVMDAIRDLAGHKTILLVAHRVTTVKHCDKIYMLEQGRIKDYGTYDELSADNMTFRAMAKIVATGQIR